MKQFFRLAVFVLLLASLWSCGASQSTPIMPTGPVSSAGAPSLSSQTQFLYVPNYDGQSVTVYSKTANGNVAPVRTISGSNTYLFHPTATAFDAAGNLYVTSGGGPPTESGSGFPTIYCCMAVFAPGANGNPVPIRLIGPDNREVTNPNDLAIDDQNVIWLDNNEEYILAFRPSQSGNTPADGAMLPAAEANLGCHAFHGIVLDPSGLLWMTDCNSPDSSIFAVVHGACGNVFPVTIFRDATLGMPFGITLDAAHNIYVADAGLSLSGVSIQPSIREFSYPKNVPLGQKFSITQIRVIAGPHTMLNDPTGIAVDTDGTIYAANSASNSITVYPPGASGDARPVRAITGRNTGLNGPRLISLH